MKTPLTPALAALAGVLALSLPAIGAASPTPNGEAELAVMQAAEGPPPEGPPPDGPPPSGPPPGGAASPLPPPPPAAPLLDERAPALKLRARRTQRLAPILRAYGTCDERCEFESSARVSGVPDLRSLRVVTPAKASDGGTRMRFEVRVSIRAEKLIWRALRAGAEVRITLRVFAYDLADNESERSVSIRVGPPKDGALPLRRS